MTQLVDELRDNEDIVELPAGWKDPESEETEQKAALLDEFHRTIPIGCLEDFSFDVVATIYEE